MCLIVVSVCRDKIIHVVVEGRHPYCWSCSVSGDMPKACSGKVTAPQPSQAATVEVAEVFGNALDSGWGEVVIKARKSASLGLRAGGHTKQQPHARPESEKQGYPLPWHPNVLQQEKEQQQQRMQEKQRQQGQNHQQAQIQIFITPSG